MGKKKLNCNKETIIIVPDEIQRAKRNRGPKYLDNNVLYKIVYPILFNKESEINEKCILLQRKINEYNTYKTKKENKAQEDKDRTISAQKEILTTLKNEKKKLYEKYNELKEDPLQNNENSDCFLNDLNEISRKLNGIENVLKENLTSWKDTDDKKNITDNNDDTEHTKDDIWTSLCLLYIHAIKYFEKEAIKELLWNQMQQLKRENTAFNKEQEQKQKHLRKNLNL